MFAGSWVSHLVLGSTCERCSEEGASSGHGTTASSCCPWARQTPGWCQVSSVQAPRGPDLLTGDGCGLCPPEGSSSCAQGQECRGHRDRPVLSPHVGGQWAGLALSQALHSGPSLPLSSFAFCGPDGVESDPPLGLTWCFRAVGLGCAPPQESCRVPCPSWGGVWGHTCHLSGPHQGAAWSFSEWCLRGPSALCPLCLCGCLVEAL